MMKMSNMEVENFSCTFTPITPIHIGSGQELLPIDYIIKNGSYYRIDFSEIYDSLSAEESQLFEKEIGKGMISFRNYLLKIYNEKHGYLYSGAVDRDFELLYTRKISGSSRTNEENQFIVKEFVGNHRGKLIPGSSIKGCLRTAFISEESDREIKYTLGRNGKTKTKPFILTGENGEIKGKWSNDKAKEIEARILGLSSLEPKEDPFKFVKVGDTEIKDDLIKICEIVRMPINKDKPAIPMGAMEVTKSLLSSGDEISLNFNMSFRYLKEGLLKSVSKSLKDEKKIYSNHLVEYLNEKSQKLLNSDLEFFKKSGSSHAIQCCEKLKNILENLRQGEALIRLGQGAGFNSSTFSLYNSSRNTEKDEPRTRVLAEKKFPMGWALIKLELKN